MVLLELASDQALQYLAFAGRAPPAVPGSPALSAVPLRIRSLPTECRPYGASQASPSYGFLDEIRSARSYRLYGEGNIALAGDDDHRQADLQAP